jgi:hypothetical protein
MGYLDVSHFVPFAGHADVDGFRIELEAANTQKAQALGAIEKVVIHWTDGVFNQVYDDYHYCIVWDEVAAKAHVVKTCPLSQLGRHAFDYNHHAVGISYCAMFVDPHTGRHHDISPAMLDAGAKFVAEFCAWHRLDPRRIDQLMDHWKVDQIIGRKQKVDIQKYWPQFLELTLAHYDALKAGHESFDYRLILTDA